MNIIKRDQIKEEILPGRIIHQAVGKTAYSPSNKMTMGFARYSIESGPMQPHHHAEEIVFILESKEGFVRKGETAETLSDPIPLKKGMVLHFPPLEWHVFEYAQGGSVDILYFYGQVDNIRPEDINE